jgi:hypothetical protein
MDKLLDKVFETQRWTDALRTGQEKGIDRSILKQLCRKSERDKLKAQILNDDYEIAPPHEAQIPKDNNEFRTVYVNTGIDRVLLAIINDVIFEMCHDMVHPTCKSYQKGLSCGKTVQQISKRIACMQTDIIGTKIDLTKYFDSVPIRYIDAVFDKITDRIGESHILTMLRKYYHMDIVLDMKKQPIEKYSSLRQGCAFAAFLADASLFDIDECISKMNVDYVRYSDDILIIGEEWESAYALLKDKLGQMELTLNPKKVEILHKNIWFKFLGFELKNDMITLSSKRIKTFQHDIEECTIRSHFTDPEEIIRCVNRKLYMGPDGYCWGTSVLPVINSDKDIQTMNCFIMDAIRAAMTGKTNIGGLGCAKTQENGLILRAKGRNVKHNKEKIPTLSNYTTLKCMQNAIRASKQAFDLLVATM